MMQGAELKAKDKDGQSALDWSRKIGYPHIEKLLMFAQLNIEAGNDIKKIAEKIQRQNGINEYLSTELSDIGDQSKKLYDDMTMELMMRMIEKRKTFSDTQLVYAFNKAMRDNEDILSSKLWLCIRLSVSDIVQNGTKSDWMWLKLCLLPSTIWYQDISKDSNGEPHYLYYELLKLVNVEAMNQINKLEQNMKDMADKQKDDWLALVEWSSPDEFELVRQDVIPNGIASQYTYDQLVMSSGQVFNCQQFYDYNKYLSQLVLLAQIVDEEFQASVQKIFQVDPVSNEGKVQSVDDEKSEVGVVEYMRGPVKIMDRARAKAQNDYFDEPFPSSACVIDFNRCALVFNDIASLLQALQMFVDKIKANKAGNIIAIARGKNGFIEYVKEAQYADIKLNVVIKGKHNSIIGEVQFLLRAMKDYKDMAHNLYAIQRKEEAIKSSVSATLPILLNQQKEIMSIACLGDVKKMCSLMILQNESIKDLMFVDKQSNTNLFHSICVLGHLDLLLFLESMMDRQEFLHHIFLSNVQDNQPIDFAIMKSHSPIVKHLFDQTEIQNRYKDNDPMIFRLCLFLFTCNSSVQLTHYVLSALDISQEKVVQMLNYKAQRPKGHEVKPNDENYHKYNLLTVILWYGSFDHFQRFVDFVGEQAFIDNAFNVDGWNTDAMHRAVEKNNLKFIEYMLGFVQIKKEYMSDSDLLFRLCQTLNAFIENKAIVQYVCDALILSKAKLKELQAFRYMDIDNLLPFAK